MPEIQNQHIFHISPRFRHIEPQRLVDLVERSTNLLGYSKLSGDFEKNNENFGILEEMAIPQHFGCGVAQN